MRALRPGGVALIEDADFLWTDIGEQPLFPASAAQAYFPVWSAAVAYMLLFTVTFFGLIFVNLVRHQAVDNL